MNTNSIFNKIVYGGGVIFDLMKWVILAIIILVLINSFWVSIFVVDGKSMEPGLHNGEIVLMDKSFFRGDVKPSRGDAVIVKYPGDPDNKKYVKRVVGMPGETLQVDSGRVYINNRLLRESYIADPVGTIPPGKWTMESDQYFLMGDNRNNSNDSRYFGPVEQRFFIGKAVNVILPSLRNIEAPQYKTDFAKQNIKAAN